MPMMPFIGVRISWLTVARKRDFAWLAYSARSRALISDDSARLRAVISRAIARCETASLILIAYREFDPRKPARRHSACKWPRRWNSDSRDPRRRRRERCRHRYQARTRLAGKVALVDVDEIGENLVGIDDVAVAVAMDDEIAQCVDQPEETLLALLHLPNAVGERLDVGAAAGGGLVDQGRRAAFIALGSQVMRDRPGQCQPTDSDEIGAPVR